MGERWPRAAGPGSAPVTPPPVARGTSVLPPARAGVASAAQPDPELARKVAFLSQAGSYPERTRRVEAVETHMSWVFLTDRHAFKLKKPVVTDYLDYGSVAARRRHCADEIRLNRRFGPDVYLGIVPLTIDAGGALHLAERGRVVDWLVQMRRLPADRMLDRAIRRGWVREADLRHVVGVLWRHYRTCAPVAMTGRAYRARLARAIDTNARELGKVRYGLPTQAYASACEQLSAALANSPALFDARAQDGRIVEGHGDLRPEHICLLARPRIIDSLEFARAFRIVDVADELAYLGLECEHLGAPAITGILFDAYARRAGERPPAALVHFYQALRACLRAKIALWHLDDPGPADGSKWVAKAHGYLALAREHAARVA